MPRAARNPSFADNFRPRESPGATDNLKHAVIVMDALHEFTLEPLRWALEYLCPTIVTLVGVMPWLNIPLSRKTLLGIWAVEFEDIPEIIHKNEGNSDLKYQKLQAILTLCNRHGVVPQKRVAMGFPLRLLVVEQITSLHPTWVVFDRHHKKNREFYAQKIPCMIVIMMNEHGEADMIRGQTLIDIGPNTPSASPASLLTTPQLIMSNELKVILEESSLEEDDKDEIDRGD